MMSTMDKNRAAVLTCTKTFHLVERAFPVPESGEVVIEVTRVGICGSDVHYWAHGKCGSFVVDGPLVLGHESSGRVVGVGPGVTHLVQGDRVAIEPGVPCRRCSVCKQGRYNLCSDVRFLATPPIGMLVNVPCERQIVMSDFHVIDAGKLPDHVSDEEGALLEPLSVAVHAISRAAIGPGCNVLILGAGPIGLVTMLVARASGATKVVMTDVLQHRLDVAISLGASGGIVSDANAPQSIRLELGGRGADVTIDCSGAEAAIRCGLTATASGGTFVSVGRGAKSLLAFPLFDTMDREIDVLGVFRYANCYPKALALVAAGAVDVRPLLSHRFSLHDVAQAFETAESGAGNAIKVMIHVTDDACGDTDTRSTLNE